MATRPTTAYNITIDDASPLIKYEPADFWEDNVSSDVNLPKYFQASYHYSINATATASLQFTGTGAWVFGGRRSINGAYSVQIDDRPAQSFEANRRKAIQYQVLLGGLSGLPFGEHRIVVKNLSTDERQPALDVDAFLVESATGNESGEMFSGPTIVDDAAVGITYSANGWVTTSRVAPPSTPWTSGSVHESDVNGASVEFSFEGQGVGIMGAVGPRNGNFRVELDDKDMGEMSAKASALHPLTPIWFASNLSAGQHRVKLTNTGSNGDTLAIDAFQVFKATPVNVSPSEASASSRSSASASVLTPAFPTPSANEDNISISRTSSLPLGLIIGGSVGGLIFLGLIAFGIVFYIRLRRKNAALKSGDVRPFTQPPPGSAVAHLPTDETRWSTVTAVEVEAGLAAAEKAERAERAGGWLRRPAKDRGEGRSTPPLPLQTYTPSPATPVPPGPNPILGTGGHPVPSSSGSRPVPSVAPTPPLSPATLPRPTPSIRSAMVLSSPKPPPRTPLPATPVLIGLPPRPRQPANLPGRTPSLDTGIGGPSRSRALTTHEIRRSRSAQVVRGQTPMERANEVILSPQSGRFNLPHIRESNISLEFDLAAYIDPRTPTTPSRVPAVPAIPQEYAPYTSRPESVQSTLESERSGGPGPRRRPRMI